MDLTGQSLTLVDNDPPMGALYVGHILGLTFDSTGKWVNDITGVSGLNIYYDPTHNPGLDGLTYDLTGGGYLEAATIPLPASVWLFLRGLAGLAARRFRKN